MVPRLLIQSVLLKGNFSNSFSSKRHEPSMTSIFMSSYINSENCLIMPFDNGKNPERSRILVDTLSRKNSLKIKGSCGNKIVFISAEPNAQSWMVRFFKSSSRMIFEHTSPDNGGRYN